MQDEKSLLEKFKEWEWDFGVLWDWFVNTSMFHIERHGWIAYAAIGLLVVIILLSNNATRYMTSYTLSTLFRSATTAVFGTIAYGIIGTFRYIRDLAMVMGRAVLRAISSLTG